MGAKGYGHPRISSISCRFLLGQTVYPTKHCSSLEGKMFGPFQWLYFLHFTMIQTCTYLYSSS